MRNKAGIVYLILLAGIFVSSYAIYMRVSETAAEARRAVDAEKLRNQYLERVGWMRTLPDAKTYQDELRPFLRDYFAQVDELVKKYNLNPHFDDFQQSLSKREAAEKSSGSASTDPTPGKILYDRTALTFTQMHDGQYQPMSTATDKGLRLDIVSADLKREAGNQIVFSLVLWGAQREIREDKGNHTQKMVALVGFDAVWKIYDAKNKLIAEVHAGDPGTRVDNPERFIPVFPPQMLLAEYKMDRIPAEAERMDMTVDVSARASWGSSQHATFNYSMPVAREWKLAPGEVWQGAQESERPQEEIDAKTKPQPSAKK